MSLTGDAKAYYNYLTQINQQNNAASAKQAERQMQFQESMSSSAHTREVRDLKNAGLNPVLSAGSGSSGASSPSGAMGQTDMSAASALTGYLQSLIQQQTSIAVAQTQAAAARDAAAMNSAAIRYSADKSYESAQFNTNSWPGLVREILQEAGLIATGEENSAQNADEVVDKIKDAAISFSGNGLILNATPQGMNWLINTIREKGPLAWNNFLEGWKMYWSGDWSQWKFANWVKSVVLRK